MSYQNPPKTKRIILIPIAISMHIISLVNNLTIRKRLAMAPIYIHTLMLSLSTQPPVRPGSNLGEAEPLHPPRSMPHNLPDTTNDNFPLSTVHGLTYGSFLASVSGIDFAPVNPGKALVESYGAIPCYIDLYFWSCVIIFRILPIYLSTLFYNRTKLIEMLHGYYRR